MYTKNFGLEINTHQCIKGLNSCLNLYVTIFLRRIKSTITRNLSELNNFCFCWWKCIFSIPTKFPHCNWQKQINLPWPLTNSHWRQSSKVSLITPTYFGGYTKTIKMVEQCWKLGWHNIHNWMEIIPCRH